MIEAIVSAALHAIVTSIVLGALLLALVAIVVKAVALRAAARHAVWTIALLAIALMPLAGLVVSAVRAVSAPPASTAPVLGAADTQRPVRSERAAQALPARTAGAPLHASAPAIAVKAAALGAWRPHLSRTVALAVVGIWVAGALIGLTGLAASVRRVRGLKKRSSPLEGDLADELPWLTENHRGEREIYLRLSYETETPVAIGFKRPVILIPTELATAGGLAAIEQLVMHEHAHLRRYDDWTNLVQRLIERIFWFNPVVWIVGRRIALEREIASDDAVVERTGHAQEYAKSLWRLAREMRMPEHAIVAPGALLTRKQISIRIESLLEGRPGIPALGPFASLGVGAVALGCIVAVATSAPALELPVPPAMPAAVVAAPSPAAVVAAHSPARARASHSAAQHASPVQASRPQPAPSVRTIVRVITLPSRPAAAATSARLAYAASSAEAPRPPEPKPQPSASPNVRRTEIPSPNFANGIRDIVSHVLRETVGSTADAWNGLNFSDGPPRDVPANADPATLAKILAHCPGCDLHGRDLHGTDLRGVRLTGVNLSGANLRDARLDDAQMMGVNLSGASLEGASLVNARLVGTSIDGISLRAAKTNGLKIVGASLANMDLHGIDVRALLEHCAACDLANDDLHGLDLHAVKLVGANLSNANLSGANLRDADLSGANLRNANLSSADLRNASFNGCSLTNADLHGADTTGTSFTGSSLSVEPK